MVTNMNRTAQITLFTAPFTSNTSILDTPLEIQVSSMFSMKS